jgi:hypothetical protein
MKRFSLIAVPDIGFVHGAFERRPRNGRLVQEACQRAKNQRSRLPDVLVENTGSVMLAGFLAFIAPCGGSSGLPKEAVRAVVAAIAAPAALATKISRLDITAHYSARTDGCSRCSRLRMTFVCCTSPH